MVHSINIEQLPTEVLQQIFILSSNHRFPLVSRTFYFAANCQTSVKTNWLLNKYDFDHILALYRGLRWRFFSKDILFQLDASYQSESKVNGDKPSQVLSFTKRPIPQRLFINPNKKNCELVKILLERGGSPDDHNGYPITKSAQLGCLEMVEVLLHYQAAPNVKDNLALKLAVKGRNISIAKKLIEAGAPVDESCIKTAEKNGHQEMVSLLESNRKAPQNSVYDIDNTPRSETTYYQLMPH
jgi:hypothetical protein